MAILRNVWVRKDTSKPASHSVTRIDPRHTTTPVLRIGSLPADHPSNRPPMKSAALRVA